VEWLKQHLPSKCEALNSNPGTTKKKKIFKKMRKPMLASGYRNIKLVKLLGQLG
jgi:hypothetical protein